MKMFKEKESGHRNRLEIIADILEVAKEGQLKTRILYDGNLSFAQLNEYLALMIKMGLLEVNMDNEKRVYRTTNKGFKYLESYEEISSLLTKEYDKPRKKSLYLTSWIFVKDAVTQEYTIFSALLDNIQDREHRKLRFAKCLECGRLTPYRMESVSSTVICKRCESPISVDNKL